MRQDLLDHRPLVDGRDDLELPAATVRAVLHVDFEDPPEQPRPADALVPGLNRLGLAFAGSGDFGGLPRLTVGVSDRQLQGGEIRTADVGPGSWAGTPLLEPIVGI